MVYVIQPSFAGGELAPSLSARIDLAKYAVGTRALRNMFVHAHGGASNRPGTEFVCEIKESDKRARLIPFQFSTQQTYVLVFGDQTLRVVMDGGQVVYPDGHETQGDPVEVATPYREADLPILKFTQSADVLYLVHPDHAPRRLMRTDHHEWTLEEIRFEPSVDAPSGVSAVAGSSGSKTYRYRVTAVKRESLEESLAGTGTSVAITGVTQADPVVVTAPGHGFSVGEEVAVDGVTGMVELNGRRFDITGVTTDTFALKDEDGADHAAYAGGGTVWRTQAYVPNAAEPSSDNPHTISWNAAEAVEKYNVYKYENGLYGWIGSTEETYFKDDNINPALDDTPPKARNPFRLSGHFPGAVTLHEQRCVFAASTESPQTFWMSKSGNYHNFSVSSPVKDDDAVTFTVAARQVNEIRHLISLNRLILLTSGGEWSASGGSENQAVTASSIRVLQQSVTGASHVPPVVVGNMILFVQEKGSIVRDLGYKLEMDGYTGNDLSILSNHLFAGHAITEWAFAQVPHSIVWCVRDDGILLALTYLREHEVWGWSRHDTDGAFESVASVSEGSEDRVYFIVRRTVNGATVRYVERLASRRFDAIADAFFVDCGLTYRGEPADVITGLYHLEGKEVAILADGNVETRRTVTDGAVTLVRPAAVVHLGLPYESDLQTLGVNLEGQNGTNQGRRIRVASVTLRLLDTRGGWVGPNADALTEMKFRTHEDWGEATRVFTGDKEIPIRPDWDRDASILIRQVDPLPLTVLAAIPKVDQGDR